VPFAAQLSRPLIMPELPDEYFLQDTDGFFDS
jgi:hypothetical protein